MQEQVRITQIGKYATFDGSEIVAGSPIGNLVDILKWLAENTLLKKKPEVCSYNPKSGQLNLFNASEGITVLIYSEPT